MTFLGISRVYLAAGVVAALMALVVWLRWDAVSDFRKKLEQKRIEHIEDAREIENEIRNRTDDDITGCLLGGDC